MNKQIAPTITAVIMTAVKGPLSSYTRRFWDLDQYCELEVTRTAEPQHGALWTFQAYVTVNNQRERILYSVGNADGFTDLGLDLAIEMSTEAISQYKRIREATKNAMLDLKMQRRISK